MGRGRAPCCDKSKVKKGPWTPAEDYTLTSFIQKQGHSNWRHLPEQAGLLRCGKSCRLRWINYLRPDLKRGNFTPQEEEAIIKLQNTMGNKWSKIASQLPGRTDNEIKNVWNTRLKKRLIINRNYIHCHQLEISNKDESLTSYSASPSPSSTSCISYVELNMENGRRGDQKEYPLSTTLVSSGHSNAPDLENFSKFEEELRHLSDNNSILNCDENAPSELQKTTNMAEDGMTEDIPLESDADFWNTLDGFGPIESSVFDSSAPYFSACSSP